MYLLAEKEEFQYELGFDSFHPLGGYYRWRETTMEQELSDAEQVVVFAIITQRQPYTKADEHDITSEILAELHVPNYNSKFSYIQGLVGKFSTN